MLAFAGGFVDLYRLLVHSQSGTISAEARLGFAVTIVTASPFVVLQAAYGIALKVAVDTWYAAAPADAEEKAIAFRVAEGISRIEIAIKSIFLTQGRVSTIFDVAIRKSTPFSADRSEE
ncbi:MAG TPA: hypothetical protein VI037_08480 [Nitrososphaera sp.]